MSKQFILLEQRGNSGANTHKLQSLSDLSLGPVSADKDFLNEFWKQLVLLDLTVLTCDAVATI